MISLPAIFVMSHRAPFDIGEYSPRDNEEAMALDALCQQGTGLSLSFRRPWFHRRAELYGDYRILTVRARQDAGQEQGQLVALAAAATKPVILFGAATRAWLAFDLRVHPAFRRMGLASLLGDEVMAWGKARADAGYTYVMSSNRAMRRTAAQWGRVDSHGYAYQVMPVMPKDRPSAAVVGVSRAEVRAALDSSAPTPDLSYVIEEGCDRSCERGSWLLRDKSGVSGCSAWSTEGVLAEVIESLPFPVSAIQWMSRHVPGVAGLWPRTPGCGERVRSWYLYDCFAGSVAAATKLFAHVRATAREAGVEWVYAIHAPRDPWMRGVRASLPRLFSPVLEYRMLSHVFSPAGRCIQHHRVDPRDV
jgi:GNAT superfamily N-acetyltransferase